MVEDENGYDLNGCRNLLAEIFTTAREIYGEEYPDYLRGPCGRFWLIVAGHDPESVFDTTVRNTPRYGETYKPLPYCPKCKKDDSIIRE